MTRLVVVRSEEPNWGTLHIQIVLRLSRSLLREVVHSTSSIMPRRPPPTPLRLVEGPLPPRRQPKHTLPSLPRPAFYPPVAVIQGPVPRPRARSITADMVEPALELPLPEDIASRLSFASVGRRSSTDSDVSSRRSSIASGPPSPAPELKYRGPWDHSSSIKIPFDVSAVLPPPKPAALI